MFKGHKVNMNQSLLPNEQKAKDFVNTIGTERAERILNAICRRLDRRYERACNQSMVPFDRDHMRRTSLEVSLLWELKTGLMLNDTYNTPQAAKARILKRIAARKERRQARYEQSSV